METKPTVSVIVPVYNTEKYIDRCVNSICSQTFQDLEIVLVDDGSQDKSGELCDRWQAADKRITVIHKANGGASSAKNTALQRVSGEFIAFVDSDDWIEPKMYERLVGLLRQHDAEMAICGMQAVKDVDKKRNAVPINTDVWERKELLDFFFRVHGENFVYSICRRLIKRTVLQGYRFIEGRMNEDIETSYYLSTHCKKAVYTNEVFYNYYKNFQGVTNSSFDRKKLDALVIWEIVRGQVPELTPEYIDACELNFKRTKFTLLSQMHINGYDKKAPEMRQIKRELKRDVQKAFPTLIKCRMSMARKVLLVFDCIF